MKKQKLYHIFTDHWDDWVESWTEAQTWFEKKKAANDNARVYTCHTDEVDGYVDDDCILSCGDFPW